MGDFRPSLKPARPEDRPDPMTIDPTLKLELLARLQTVKFEGGQRSLFEFSAEPPKAPEPKIIPTKKEEQKKVARVYGPLEPPPPEPPKPTPAKPPPPPIPLKFYGFANPAMKTVGPKRAFFLEGDEIHVAAEGEMVKKRYKVVRIGVNSVIVEDTEHKHQQTLPLEEQVGTGG